MKNCRTRFSKQTGMSLVELMVGLVIGLVLSGAAVLVYSNSKHAFGIQNNTTSIQENGRFALHLLKQDVRMAGYWGFNYLPNTIVNAETITLTNECAGGWSTSVTQPISILNNENDAYTACIPNADYHDGPQDNGTDILTVRHAASEPTTDANIEEDHVYLRASLNRGAIFIADSAGSVDSDAVDAVTEVPVTNHELLAHAYYVRPWSQSVGDNIPTLVRETISADAVTAEPLIEYVEDFQVTFGLDTDLDGNVDSYANGTSAAAFSDDVVTVILEILVRAPNAEADYTNQRTYTLGDSGNFAPGDNIRRQVFRETVFLRNWTGLGSV